MERVRALGGTLQVAAESASGKWRMLLNLPSISKEMPLETPATGAVAPAPDPSL